MTDVEDHGKSRRSVVAGLQRGAEFAVGGQAGMRRLRQALEPEVAIRAVQTQAEVGMAPVRATVPLRGGASVVPSRGAQLIAKTPRAWRTSPYGRARRNARRWPC